MHASLTYLYCYFIFLFNRPFLPKLLKLRPGDSFGNVLELLLTLHIDTHLRHSLRSLGGDNKPLRITAAMEENKSTE